MAAGQCLGSRKLESKTPKGWRFSGLICGRCGEAGGYYLNLGRDCRCARLQPSEKAVYAFVQSHYPDADWCVVGRLPRRFELDVYVPGLNKAIEIDGGVHEAFESHKRNDARKTRFCQKFGIPLLRVRAEFVDERPSEAFASILSFLRARETEHQT